MQAELKSVLMVETHPPAVSIFLPTHRAGQAIQQDPIRLKNLVKQAEEQLVTDGIRPADARALLAPVADLIDNAKFWRHQGEGLAVFRSRDVMRTYQLPFGVEEFVAVSDRFHIKPLLPWLLGDARFFILALSQKRVRLLECTQHHVSPVEVPDLPQGMEEALPEGPSPQVQRHTLPMEGKNAARFHGHGVGTDDVDIINLTRYFHRIHDVLEPAFSEQRAPLILACVEYLVPIFKQVSHYRFVLDDFVGGNPDGRRDEELHRDAWPLAEAYFRRAREQAKAEFEEGLAKGRAGHTLTDVLPAAFQGRIATLFIPQGIQRWGRFDFDRLALEEHEAERPGDDELLDLAAVQTLRHAGTVYAVPPHDLPGGCELAAVFRF